MATERTPEQVERKRRLEEKRARLRAESFASAAETQACFARVQAATNLTVRERFVMALRLGAPHHRQAEVARKLACSPALVGLIEREASAKLGIAKRAGERGQWVSVTPEGH